MEHNAVTANSTSTQNIDLSRKEETPEKVSVKEMAMAVAKFVIQTAVFAVGLTMGIVDPEPISKTASLLGAAVAAVELADDIKEISDYIDQSMKSSESLLENHEVSQLLAS